jgi:hypothetical protein
LLLTATAVILGSAIFGASPNFVPDYVFKGSSLTGWQKAGASEWRADNGEIVATANEAGGWLMFEKPYQDVQIYMSFRCGGACKPGVLLRSDKTPEGTKGVLVSLATGDVAAYDVVLDKDGKEVSRTKLSPGPGPMTRMSGNRPGAAGEAVPGFSKPAQTPAEIAAASPNAGGGGGGRGGRGAPAVAATDWNTVQITLDMDILGVALNGRGGLSATTNDRMMGFGRIALYAGGAGEIRFKDVSVKNVNPKVEPKETVSTNFQMHRLNDFYYGWSAAAGDFNHDGVKDVTAGPYYFVGPDYTERHEFTAARTYNPSNQFAQAMVNFAYDVTGDGWDDIIVVDQRPIYLFVNPKGESRRWDRYLIVAQASTELELFKDIDGDGKPEILFGGDGAMAYAKPDPANPTGPWVIKKISDRIQVNAHGMGVGDLSGDGKMDIVTARGWWQQPATPSSEPWPFHAASFGNGGAEMAIYDVNGDGLNDVVTAIAAHGWGLAWFEQKRNGAEISFVQHQIMGDFSAKSAGNVTFSELHGSTFADMDGDGIPDFIVGKRHFSHLDSYLDPDPFGPAVLYWYRTVRNPKAEGGAEFVPELIHNRSGVGSHLAAVDLNNDGSVDVITSTNRGTFIFWNKMRPARGTATGRR